MFFSGYVFRLAYVRYESVCYGAPSLDSAGIGSAVSIGPASLQPFPYTNGITICRGRCPCCCRAAQHHRHTANAFTSAAADHPATSLAESIFRMTYDRYDRSDSRSSSSSSRSSISSDTVEHSDLTSANDARPASTCDNRVAPSNPPSL